jgi:hypothetical protein
MKSSYTSLLLAGASVAVAAPLPESATAQGLDIPFELQNILRNTDGSSAYTYPTSLTRGIVPVGLCWPQINSSIAKILVLETHPFA